MNKRVLSITVFALCVLGFSFSGHAAEVDPSSAEYAIKAAFLYNLTKFIEWPAAAWSSDSDPFFIVILGSDPFGETINVLQDKDVRGRKIVVQRVEVPEKVGPCHILFISDSERDRIKSITERFQDKPVLIVGDSKNFARHGGMVGLIRRENKVQIEINPNAAARSGFKISSQLLKLAVLVNTE